MADVFKGVDLDNIDTGYILREGQKKIIKGRVVDNNLTKIIIGDSFFASYVAVGIASEGFLKIEIENPVGHDKNIAVQINIDVEGKAYFKSYRDYTLSDNGTPILPINLNMGETGDSKSTDVLVKRNVVVSTPGTLRFNRVLPFGTGGNSTGGGSNQVITILEINRKLLLEIQNKSGQAKDIGISIKFDEYEIY